MPRSLEAREVLFEDRTRAHADHVGHGLDRMTTGAVGILKAVRCGDEKKPNRVTKVIVIIFFSPMLSNNNHVVAGSGGFPRW